MIGDIVTTDLIVNRFGGIEYNFLMKNIVDNIILHIFIKFLAIIILILLINKIIEWIKKTNNYSIPSYVSIDLSIITICVWFLGVNIFNLMSIL